MFLEALSERISVPRPSVLLPGYAGTFWHCLFHTLSCLCNWTEFWEEDLGTLWRGGVWYWLPELKSFLQRNWPQLSGICLCLAGYKLGKQFKMFRQISDCFWVRRSHAFIHFVGGHLALDFHGGLGKAPLAWGTGQALPASSVLAFSAVALQRPLCWYPQCSGWLLLLFPFSLGFVPCVLNWEVWFQIVRVAYGWPWFLIQEANFYKKFDCPSFCLSPQSFRGELQTVEQNNQTTVFLHVKTWEVPVFQERYFHCRASKYLLTNSDLVNKFVGHIQVKEIRNIQTEVGTSQR